MTQKSAQFRGQQKNSAAANRHGKAPHIRKGKQFKPPLKKTEEFEVEKEVSKFINAANERKAATQASKAESGAGSRNRCLQSFAEEVCFDEKILGSWYGGASGAHSLLDAPD